MTTRYEGAGAKDVSLTVAEAGEEVGEDVVPEGQVALLFNYDEVFYVQGTKPDVLTMLDRARDELRPESPGPTYTGSDLTLKMGRGLSYVIDRENYSLDPEDGNVTLAGFQSERGVQRVSLFADDWRKDPQKAVGMYPVFIRDGGMFNLTIPVESVEEPAVTAKVETEAGSPDIAWVRYGNLSVAVTRTLDGAIAISVESTTETPVRVAFSTTEKTLWEGEVR